ETQRIIIVVASLPGDGCLATPGLSASGTCHAHPRLMRTDVARCEDTAPSLEHDAPGFGLPHDELAEAHRMESHRVLSVETVGGQRFAFDIKELDRVVADVACARREPRGD